MRHGRAGRSLQHRRAAVDRELRFAVEDDEHLFALIVEVRADAALRLDDAAVQEVQVRVERRRVEEPHVVELAGAAVHARRRAILCRLGVRDALGERQLLRTRGRALLRQQRAGHHRDDRRYGERVVFLLISPRTE